MEKEEYQQEVYEEMKELDLDDTEDTEENRFLNQQEMQEGYGSPQVEERHNQHTFLANSLNLEQPEKVTFMTISELGTPLFNLRFLLDIEDICKYYLDDLSENLGLQNKISLYFRDKIKNISDSGMSYEGFVQKLNVTKKMESTRQRIKNLGEMKGGKK